jgi:RimJ/RimL family protein N-acetyltransferase
MITTDRLNLVAATVELARAELHDREAFARALSATVPENWPPETLADALAYFLELAEANPAWEGWLAWYAVTRAGTPPPVLVGSVGFKGPPGSDGAAEIGYSVLPQYQGCGYATEMAEGLIGWARETGKAHAIVAQTTDDNAGSRRVLSKLGFVAVGPGEEADHTLYRLELAARRGV